MFTPQLTPQSGGKDRRFLLKLFALVQAVRALPLTQFARGGGGANRHCDCDCYRPDTLGGISRAGFEERGIRAVLLVNSQTDGLPDLIK